MNTGRCCSNYTRSNFLRSAAAKAGSGLPGIEPGMPVPAGTGLTRRGFIAGAAGLAVAVYAAGKTPLPLFEDGIAEAAQSDRILVSIFLDGGADTLSLLAPVGHSRYHDLRPVLALDESEGTPFSEDPSLHWHPSAAAIAQLHSEGKVTVFPAVGYDGANQSHFTSRHFWEVGELETDTRTGWMGRYIDLAGSDNNPLQGLSLSNTLAPALATHDKPVAAVEGVTDYDLWSWTDAPVSDEMFKSFKRMGSMKSESPALRDSRKAIRATNIIRESLESFGDFESPVTYPDARLGQQLSGLAALLGAGMPLHCVSVSADGAYDTHSDQKQEFDGAVKATSDSILAFQRDLEARGLQDRVLMQVWSEFGRRPEENGSAGTDHGAAGVAMIIGSKARGQMVGEFPGLVNLDEDDNLRHTSDFRAMYCSLLEDWFGHDAAPIIPGAANFARPVLLK
ncbi:MAG TPA: DUF1501 domain-containing protein [Solirubrobacterales bacterium]|nr:DUF1501 domain-containing protein [Solirubrobacterales bacterium]HMU26109.1 DUF1501 domain-containing protein [Solirubrobacterales bacterium]HMX71545.1 DUF1501 domain-containing protein [Solirubrobacterales bacterium]HNA23420.1 DUF1501 domain-containing protein [Solirubrobacterales bacterium]HNA43235.1 DUF1501 domain-containing protein [Solirubrobacterales bacterium]